MPLRTAAIAAGILLAGAAGAAAGGPGAIAGEPVADGTANRVNAPSEPLVLPVRPGSAPLSAADLAASTDERVRFAPREVLVRFQSSADASERSEARAEVGGRLTEAWELVPGLQLLRIPAGESVTAAVGELEDNPDVLYASPNVIMELQATPNDPRFGELWGMNDIRAPLAWAAGTGSRDVTVAVLDTGVQIDHPDLKDNIWRNPGETAGNGIDDDANGYIDDVNGWDFLGNDNSPGYEGEPSGAHGTHVAGTIGAVGDNGLGVAGVNWRSSIMPLTICNKGGSCYLDAAISALQYAVDKGARVSNNSYGGAGCSYTPLRDAISAAGARGHLFVAAAGNSEANNDLDPHCPASYGLPNIISVAATTAAGSLAWFSNYGESVDLAAPGEGIVSTLPEGGFGLAGGYGALSGTSMASPHVAGAAAILFSQHPDWTVAQVKERLLMTTRPLNPASRRTPKYNRLDLNAAVTGAVSGLPVRISRDGTGNGVVRSTPAGIECGTSAGENSCVTSLPPGTSVTLTATARDGGTFAGWSGACTGSGACTIEVNDAARVKAVFRGAPNPAWEIHPVHAYDGRSQPLPTLDSFWSFNGIAMSGDGQVRTRTIFERGSSCPSGSGESGGISIETGSNGTWPTNLLVNATEARNALGTRNYNLPCWGLGDNSLLSADGSSLLLTQSVAMWSDCSALIYRQTDGAWRLVSALRPFGVGDDFDFRDQDEWKLCGTFGTAGSAISRDGSRVAIAMSTWDSTAQLAAASIEVFRRVGSNYEREERIEIPEAPSCPNYSAPQRLAISGDGDRILFGQPNCHRGSGANLVGEVGRVLAYSFDGSRWQLAQTIEPTGPDIRGGFGLGSTVRISEDGGTAVLSKGDGGVGGALVLRYRSGRWETASRLEAPAVPAYQQRFLQCPAVSRGGERILCFSTIGSPGSTEAAGALLVYDRGSGWGTQALRNAPEQVVPPEGLSGDLLGVTGWLKWAAPSITRDGRTIVASILPQVRLGDRYPDYRIGYQFTGPAAQVSIAAPQVGGSDNPPPQRSRTFSVSFSSPDGAEGVTGFECSAGDSGWSACSSPREFTGLADGTHQLRIRAVGSGDARSAAVTRTIVVDNVPPGPPSTSSRPASRTRERSPSFAFAGESGASFECRLDNDPWGSCTSPKSYASLPDGDHTFQVRQADRAGNTSDPETWSWNIDATPPGAPAVDGPSGSIIEDQATFTFTGEPGGQFECRLVSNAPDSGPWTRCTSPFLASGLSHGTHHFSVRQSDDLGNVGARTVRSVSFAPPASLPATPDPGEAPGPITGPVTTPVLPPASTPASAPASFPNLAPAAPAASLPVPATIAAAPEARPSARSVSVATTVNAPGPGIVVVRIRRWGGSGSEPLCRARIRVTEAGEASVTCRMGSAARETMRRRAQRVVVEVTFTPAGGKPVTSRSSATLPRRR